jgi:hypothetical protein
MDISKLELTLAICRGKVSDLNLKNWKTDWNGLKDCLSKPKIGNKDGSYFLRCAGELRTNKETANDGFIIILDGDTRINENGELCWGAPDPEKVHEVLTGMGLTHLIYSSHSNNATKEEIEAKIKKTNAKIDSGGVFGADFFKYRVVIPCHYTRDQLPKILDYLFSKLVSFGVLLADVNENKKWAQAWYLPRVPDKSRLDSFQFFHFEGAILNAEEVTKAWLLEHPAEPPTAKTQRKQSTQSSLLAFEDFNKKFPLTEILLRNGYQQIGEKFLRPNSESGIPGVKLLTDDDGSARVYSHSGDVLNDGKVHDAFDVFALLEHGGNKGKALAFFQQQERRQDHSQKLPPLSTYEADNSLMGHARDAVDTNTASKPSRAASILNTISDNVVDVITALPKIAEHCVNSKVSEFELAQIIEGLCKRFDQKDKKTVLAKTLKDQIKNYRQQSFQQATIAFGSVPIHDAVPKNTFPNSFFVEGNIRLDTTFENLQHLLYAHGVTVEYDVMLKKEVLNFPADVIGGHTDLANEAGVQMIRSLSSKSGLSMTAVDFLPILLDGNPRNHVIEWITSKTWDGQDRIVDLAKTIDVPKRIKTQWPEVLKLWLIQCAAAADGGEKTTNRDAISKYESVLVLVGAQGKTKTAWFNQLVPTHLKHYLADGMHLRVGNRDSEKIATSFWIVELGELDATFRKSDIANLKAFLSRQSDTMRMAYARRENCFQRRTSFAASVNAHYFLTDMTGNRRFWPIEVKTIKPHAIDLQQLWRQVWDDYVKGAAWWATGKMEKQLKDLQTEHTEICAIEDAFTGLFDLKFKGTTGKAIDKSLCHYSCKDVASKCGIEATQKNLNKIATLLRDNHFKKVTVNGKRGYYIKTT